MTFTADSRQLLSAGKSGTVARWNLGTGEAIKVVGRPVAKDDSMEASPSRRRHMAADCSGVPFKQGWRETGNIRVRHATTGEPVREIGPPSGLAETLAVSPNGQ